MSWSTTSSPTSRPNKSSLVQVSPFCQSAWLTRCITENTLTSTRCFQSATQFRRGYQGTGAAKPLHLSGPRIGETGHKLNYSFTQWASCFVTYMAALAANNNNIVHMCAYFQVILKASREYAGSTWKHYDAQYRKKAEATLY